jgi:N-acetylglucosaminyldiphosphoundecaprenol N-acetyl-beta-D-mannosaminyltransferase
MNIMNYEVFTNVLDTLDLSKRQVINTINPHSYVTAKSDKLFTTALKESDLLIADGSGIVMAAKHINKKTIPKIAGADLHKFLLEEMNKKGGKVFYMGAAPKTLEKIETKIKEEYPNIKVSSYSPPFKPEFTDEENQEIIQKVNEFQPDVLFIGMTAPKQEKWLHTHKNDLEFTIASSIGAVFDFYAGNVQRSSQFWIDMHLEWLPRLLQEPKRLWRRNFVSTPLFLLDMFLFKFGIKK